MDDRPVLLTGATGFIGSYLHPALRAAGVEVRCGSRRPDRAHARHPANEWVELDVGDEASVRRAMEGCRAAYYLVHHVGSGAGYGDRELRAAERIARAASDTGVERIIYLGGVAPAGASSEHLRSRLRTGAVLRGGAVPVIELRAAMIIGAGGSSWQIVRDLARRLPAMVLPRWLRNHSWPIAIDDAIAALVAALTAGEPGWYDLPGPERLAHRALLERAALQLRHRRPMSLGIPLLTPRLSSYWIGWVTDVDLELAKQLVEGLRTDLDPTGTLFWNAADVRPQVPVDAAIANAIADEHAPSTPSPRACERVRARVARLPAQRAAAVEAPTV